MNGISRALLLFLVSAIHLSSVGQSDIAKKIDYLLLTMERQHLTGLEKTKENSQLVSDLFLDQLDPNHTFLLQDEVDSLNQYGEKLLVMADSESRLYYRTVSAIYWNSIERAKQTLGDFNPDKIAFNAEEQLSYAELDEFCSSPACLEKRWLKLLKYRNAIQLSNEIIADSIDIKSLDPKLGFAKAKVQYQCKMDELLDDREAFDHWLEETLLDAFCRAYDPHSSYFSPVSRGEFESQLSANVLSYGLEFDFDDEENIIVSYLVPGGPAWNSNSIHQNDQLLAVHVHGGENILSPCMEPDELLGLLSFSEETSIELKLKKVEGTIKTVKLVNDELVNEGNNLSSYILEGDRKIGYIGLPGFYTTWNGEVDLGSANDMGRAILKMKQDNIEGLILDLRFNGGGSVQEALEISGSFITEGSLSIRKIQDASPRLLKDPHRGRVYTGPLIVLINEVSASASEITAGILQDHNRAIIVGNQSFGKGTGQIIVPVTRSAPTDDLNGGITDSPYGFVKVTCCKFYNLSGSTHQAHGIEPDIILPSLYDAFAPQEKEFENAIEADQVEKKTYYTPYPEMPLDALRSKSQERIDANPAYAEMLKAKQAVMQEQDSESIPLAFEPLMQSILSSETVFQNYAKIGDYEHEDFEVTTPSYDNRLNQMGGIRQELHEQIQRELKSDLHLQEAYFIINDLIQNSK